MEATAVLTLLSQHPGYPYLSIDVGWQTLCERFFPKLYGTKQITDAYLLGLAVRNSLVLVTMDKAMIHLAGPEYKKHVLVLQSC
jgi:hypothetical protein